MAGNSPITAYFPNLLLRISPAPSPTTFRFLIRPLSNRDNTTHVDVPYDAQALLAPDSTVGNANPHGYIVGGQSHARRHEQMLNQARHMRFGTLASELHSSAAAGSSQVVGEKGTDETSDPEKISFPERFGAYVAEKVLPGLLTHLERAASFVHRQPTLSSLVIFSTTLFRAYRIEWCEIAQMATLFASPMFFSRVAGGSARATHSGGRPPVSSEDVATAHRFTNPTRTFTNGRILRSLGRMAEVGTQAFFLPLAFRNMPTLFNLLGGVLRINMPKVVRIGLAQGKRGVIAQLAHRSSAAYHHYGMSMLGLLGGVVALGTIATLAVSRQDGTDERSSPLLFSSPEFSSRSSESFTTVPEDAASDAGSVKSEQSAASSEGSTVTIMPGNIVSRRESDHNHREEMLGVWIDHQAANHRQEAQRRHGRFA